MRNESKAIEERAQQMTSEMESESDTQDGEEQESTSEINGQSELPVKTNNLEKTYPREEEGTVKVFEGLNIAIKPSEFVSIVGPSGCGKTTLLRVLGGLEKPTSGSVYIKGKEAEGPTAEKGFVFQKDAVFPWKTVEENVRYGPKLRGWPSDKINRRVNRFLEVVGLADYKEFYPKSLSGGMRKRVAIAMIFANDPDILFMDEPFGSLDYMTKRELQDELLDIWEKEQKTTLFVTHDIEEAVYLSDRIIFLDTTSTGLATFDVLFDRPRDQSLKNTDVFQNKVVNIMENFD